MADLNDLAVTLPDGIDVAELHGLVCGMACADPGCDPELRLRTLCDLLGPVPGTGGDGSFDADAPVAAPLAQFIDAAEAELAAAELVFMPLLPDDDEALEHRLLALAQWCSGFLAGFGATADAGELSPDGTEALADIARIAEVDARRGGIDTEGGQGDEAGADPDGAGEDAFMHVVEYLKVVVLVLRQHGAVAPRA